MCDGLREGEVQRWSKYLSKKFQNFFETFKSYFESILVNIDFKRQM